VQLLHCFTFLENVAYFWKIYYITQNASGLQYSACIQSLYNYAGSKQKSPTVMQIWLFTT